MKRRELSPEQAEASQLRRERFRALCKQIGALSEEARVDMARRMPALFTCEGHALSTFNACLVASQRPDATVLGGFQQWRKQGRCVKKGSHGVALFVPKHKEGENTKFLPVYVFDVSDTEPIAGRRELPEHARGALMEPVFMAMQGGAGE